MKDLFDEENNLIVSFCSTFNKQKFGKMIIFVDEQYFLLNLIQQ